MSNQSLLYAVLTSTLFVLFHSNAPAQSENRSQTIKDIDSLRKQVDEKEKKFLSPSAEDLALHAEFLKQSNTGLIRLFPSGLYEDKLMIRGGGSFYSFLRLSHEYGYGSDIMLRLIRRNDHQVLPLAEYNFVSGFMGHGFITVIGDIPLEQVTLDHDAVKFLFSYKPPSTVGEMQPERQRATVGIEKDGFMYKNSALVIPDYTYALRSINFDRSDVLVALRVVRRESDGSVVILWKMLKRFSKPELIRTAAW